ncbi:CHAT domain-containing protein, partial [Myxococcota bacterium]|nr:CHAT domain-containing protein [Myxococcota bacterium]
GRRPATAAPEAGRARSLADRAPVEVLAERASKLVVVEAPVHVEPSVPERSVVSFAPAPITEPVDDEAWQVVLEREADRFTHELPIEALSLPARTLVLARVSPRPAGALRTRVRSADALRLDVVLAQRGFATTILVPETVPAAAAERVLAAYAAALDDAGPAKALAQAIRAEAATTPSVSAITMIGSPGLDRAGTRAFAQSALAVATKRMSSLFKRVLDQRTDHDAAIAAAKRLRQLAREAGDEKNLQVAYTLLVKLLVDLHPRPDPSRGADQQRELLALLASRPKSPANDKAIANAKAELGRIYALAGDHEAAVSTLEAAIPELEGAGDLLGAGRARLYLGQHYERDRLDFQKAAAIIEQSIATFESAKAYTRKPADQLTKAEKTAAEESWRGDPGKAVRAIGSLYLNRLGDPARAQAAYERALAIAPTAEDRAVLDISLARVARRRGDFQQAAELAERLRANAVKNKLAEIEVDAIVEAANVAWFQGDYRRGQDLCTESLEKVQGLKPEARRRRKIFALSVCGLIAMSRREFTLAKETLERARKIAETLKDGGSEAATQWNNLGRVYLEFGKVDEAIDAFRRALAIDEGLQDRFALAYDLRNLGTALAYRRDPQAEPTLARGLQYAVEVQDSNNELRARFALAELARERDDRETAKKLYDQALPLATSLDVKELAWQIHRARGLMLAEERQTAEAEVELRKAVQIVRSITGRSAASDFGPQRYAAFDDLITLLLEGERTAEAFEVANLARSLEETELLDDGRIRFSSPEVPRLVRAVREARTATVASAALDRLGSLEPSLAALLSPVKAAAIAERLPKDSAIVMYRIADEEVITFVVDASGLVARRTAISGRVLGEHVREYGRRLSARADLATASARLAEVLVDPIRDLVATKARLAIVPHRSLRYVAFAALPFQGGELVVDRFVTVQALDPWGAALALAEPLGPVGALPIVALGAPDAPPPGLDPPLPFAKKELETIREEYPRTTVVTGERVTRRALLDALASSEGVVHFAGHSRLGAGGTETFVDPLAGELRTSDGGLKLLELLSIDATAKLVVLSSCSSLLAEDEARADGVSGDELLSLGEALHVAGVENVLATTMRVNDIAAAMMMKRFYRAARTLDAPAALREAQRSVRSLYPHPAWWASFVLLGR